jgi:hypothetical protein
MHQLRGPSSNFQHCGILLPLQRPSPCPHLHRVQYASKRYQTCRRGCTDGNRLGTGNRLDTGNRLGIIVVAFVVSRQRHAPVLNYSQLCCCPLRRCERPGTGSGPGSSLAQNSIENTSSRATGEGAAFLRIKPVVRGVRGFAASLSLISRPAKRRTGGVTRMLSGGIEVRAAWNHRKQEGTIKGDIRRSADARLAHSQPRTLFGGGQVRARSIFHVKRINFAPGRPSSRRSRAAAAAAKCCSDRARKPVTKWRQGNQNATGRGWRGGARAGSDLLESLAACGDAWPAPPRTPKSRAGPCTSSRLPCPPSSTPLCPRAEAT